MTHLYLDHFTTSPLQSIYVECLKEDTLYITVQSTKNPVVNLNIYMQKDKGLLGLCKSLFQFFTNGMWRKKGKAF